MTNPFVFTLQGRLVGASLPLTVGPDGVSVEWTQLDGPSTITFSDPHVLNPVATVNAAGVYTVRLTAFLGAASRSAQVKLSVVDPLPPVPDRCDPAAATGLWSGYVVGADSPYYVGTMIPPGPYPAQGVTPFVPPGVVGPGTPYSMGFDPVDLDFLYQRDSVWNVASTLRFGSQGGEIDFDQSQTFPVAVPKIASCPPPSLVRSEGNMIVRLFGDGNPATPWAYSWNGLVYPYLSVELVAGIFHVSNTPVAVFTKSWTTGGGGVLSLLGKTAPLCFDEAGGYDSVDGQLGDRGPYVQRLTGGVAITVS